MTWHLDPAAVQRYRDGRISAAQAASVDTHLVACAACRAVVVDHRDDAVLDRVKRAIDVQLDTVQPRTLERLLRRIGVGTVDARIMGTSLDLAGSWVIASSVVLAFAALAAAAGADRLGFAAFLVVAPLVPMAAVALAFGPGLDPAHQITVAAPVPTARIVLLRSLTAVGIAIPALLLLSFALPGLSALAFAWLLPALGLAAAALALATVMPVSRAAALLAGLWLVAAGVGLTGAPRTSAESFVQAFIAFRPGGQLTFALVTVVCLAAASARRSAFEEVR